MSLNFVKVSLRQIFKYNSARTLVSSNVNFSSKEIEREVLGLVYQKQFDEAIEKWRRFEISNPETSTDRSGYFRLKLVSHLITNGFEDCFNLLESMEAGIITDEQFSTALDRILTSESLQNPVEAAVKFYKNVVESGIYRKRNRDLLIRKIICKATTLPDASFAFIWELYSQLLIIEPSQLSVKEVQIRQKLHPATLWEIIKFTNLLPANKKKNLEILKNFIISNASPIQAGCLLGSWLLYEDKMILFTDAVLAVGKPMSSDHIKFLMVLSSITKEPRFLQAFLSYPEFFSKPELLAKLCEELALILGKNNDFQGLEALYKRINEIYRNNPIFFHISYFKKAIHRISHFYKCANMACPEDLVVLVKRVQ